MAVSGLTLSRQPSHRSGKLATPPTIDLGELFLLIVSAKRSLWTAIDGCMEAEHGLTLEAFYVLTAIAERDEGCDAAELATALAIRPDEVGPIVHELVASGYLRPNQSGRGAGATRLSLTLRGSRSRSRAEATLERALARRIRSELSVDEIAQVENSLAAMLLSARSAAGLDAPALPGASDRVPGTSRPWQAALQGSRVRSGDRRSQ
jgi:DNA-binding MarR family transcriptional regulator